MRIDAYAHVVPPAYLELREGQGGRTASIYAFNTKTEKVENLGPAAVASNTYIGAIDADPTGRYLYYVPGAHGG